MKKHIPIHASYQASEQNHQKWARSAERLARSWWIWTLTRSLTFCLIARRISLPRGWLRIRKLPTGLTLQINNGQTEGHVTRIKRIERMMYGKAEFALLRQRVLHRI